MVSLARRALARAAALLALVDGLMMHALIGEISSEAALATFDYHLDRILIGANDAVTDNPSDRTV